MCKTEGLLSRRQLDSTNLPDGSVCVYTHAFFEMPIANSVYGILFDNKNPLEAVKELMTRNLTAEKR